MDEQDIYFWMSVHNDFNEAEACLTDLRSHYPLARLAVRVDGDDDPRYSSFRESFGAEVHNGPRIFTVEHGGLLVATMLEMFLATQCRYLFKIDPDTQVHRPFHQLPAEDCIFGTVQGGEEYRSIQGGCLGITRNAAAVLANSGLLASPELCHPQAKAHESRYWEILSERAKRVGLSSFDWAIGWAANELSLPLIAHGEVHSLWQTVVDNSDLRYAITHPRAHSEPHRFQYMPESHPLFTEPQFP